MFDNLVLFQWNDAHYINQLKLTNESSLFIIVWMKLITNKTIWDRQVFDFGHKSNVSFKTILNLILIWKWWILLSFRKLGKCGRNYQMLISALTVVLCIVKSAGSLQFFLILVLFSLLLLKIVLNYHSVG